MLSFTVQWYCLWASAFLIKFRLVSDTIIKKEATWFPKDTAD